MFSLTMVMVCFASSPFVIEAEHAEIRSVGAPHPQGWNIFSNGEASGVLRVFDGGAYAVSARASGTICGGILPRMALVVDGMPAGECDVETGDWREYPFSIALEPGVHTLGAAFLNDAKKGKEDRNLFLDKIVATPPEGARDVVAATLEAWSESQVELERGALAEVDAHIRTLRMGEVTVHVTDASGNPVAGARVTATLTRHEFLFGCNLYKFDQFDSAAKNAAYKARFEDVFNYATIPFYWQWYEPERGKPHYETTDTLVAWCSERGIRMKGHPLLWCLEAGIPPWCDGIPGSEDQQARIQAVMGRYADRIAYWEVVNEPAHESAIRIDAPYRWARAVAPGAFLILNDYSVLDKGYPPFFELLRDAVARDIPFDGIGIQAHEPADMAFPLHRVQQILDRYATLGKALHITEFNECSNERPVVGSPWRGTWTEAAQAAYARDFYRLCFAHPAVAAITWWDLCDEGAWREHGGLLHADLSPKPVYEALLKLIKKDWSTQVEVTTDAEGNAAFRGFGGAYQVAVQHDILTAVSARELRQGVITHWDVALAL